MHAWVILGFGLAAANVVAPSEHLIDAVGSGWAEALSSLFSHAGSTGVALFYAISGFLLYQPFVRSRLDGTSVDPWHYALRRAARIVPAYWAALILIGLLTGNQQVFTLKGVINYFLFGEIFTTLDLGHLAPFQRVGNPVNLTDTHAFTVISGNPIQVAWTLCVEASFYAVLPVWAWLAGKVWRLSRHPFAVETGLLLAVVAGSLAYKDFVISRVVDIEYEPWLMILPASADIFAAGMLLALLAVRARSAGWPRPLAMLGRVPALTFTLGVAVYVGLCLLETGWDPDPAKSLFGQEFARYGHFLHQAKLVWGGANVVIAFLLLAPAVIGADRQGALRRFLTARAVAWVGLVSYGLYLWHVWVLREVADLFDGPVQFGVAPFVALACYLLALAVAAASWYFIERRVLAWAHGLPLRRARPPSAEAED